jgi:hypothetical protein
MRVFIPYFGKWPEWIDLFFETLRRNSTIDFLIYTDCEYQKYRYPNIEFQNCTFAQYVEMANQYLDFRFSPPNAYKICDLRPLFGHIHQKEFAGYDFYGWCDIDLLFGDIRTFYTDKLLSRFDVFSTHNDRISGHFALFRNNSRNRLMYKKIYKWREALQEPKFVGIDEHGITNAYRMTFFDKFSEKFKVKFDNLFTRFLSRRKISKLYMVEQYTTPFIAKPWIDASLHSSQPGEWFYRDGEITNSRDGDRKFIYLHFMNFKSSQWRHDGTKAPWEGKRQICFANKEDMKNGLIISENGIHPLL